MKTKKCKHCQEEISKKAKLCPKCGCKLGLPGFVKVLIIIAIIITCVVGCVSGCTNTVDKAVKDTANSYNDINGKTSFKENETFQNKYEKLTMIEVNTDFKDYDEYSEPSDGKKIIALKFEVENVSEDSDELYVSSLSFNAYADGVAAEKYYSFNDKYTELSATLSKGKKAVGYLFYEVPEDANKITVSYNADFWTDGNAIEFIVK